MIPRTVRECMTSAPYTVLPDMPVEVARRLMADRRIRQIPVVENRRIVGLVFERDVLTAKAGALIRDCMRAAGLVVTSDTPLVQLVKRMAERKAEVALVVDNDRLAGIFTTIDALDVLAAVLEDGAAQTAA